MRNRDVHFRYHDLISGLTGRHAYHYERVKLSDVPALVNHLEGKGYDEFFVREFRPYEPWRPALVHHKELERISGY